MPEADDLLLPVPEVVGAIYVVPTDRPPADPRAWLRTQSRWGRPVEAAVARFVDRGTVSVRPIGELTSARYRSQAPVARKLASPREPSFSIETLGATGAGEKQLRRLRAASHGIVLASPGRPGWPPMADWATRAAAVALAEHLGTDIIDLPYDRVLTAADAADSLPDDETGQIRLADWLMVPYAVDTGGYWVTTIGLGRFGLPELQALAVPPNSVGQWAEAMPAIAGALLCRWCDVLARNRGAAFVTLPATLGVGPEDVATADRRGPLTFPGTGPARVRFGLDADPDAPALLTVQPPLDWPGSAGEHVAEVCASLFGPRTSEVRYVSRGEQMEEAIAIARAGLTGIRNRFEAGELSKDSKLLIKYALPAEEGTEYLWAYVTSWRDPYRILGTSAADAIYHPKIRTGRPVVVDTSAVVDWAVEVDGSGIVEGYWTRTSVEEA